MACYAAAKWQNVRIAKCTQIHFKYIYFVLHYGVSIHHDKIGKLLIDILIRFLQISAKKNGSTMQGRNLNFTACCQRADL